MSKKHGMLSFIKYHITTIICSFLAISTVGQGRLANEHGLHVISTKAELLQCIKKDARNTMLDVRKHIPGILLDLKYSTDQNFLHRKLYPRLQTTYLRKPATEALARVQNALAKKGLGLKIWDAYRPYPITVQMWEAIPDERYAANPKYGSGHNRGVAVDLTLVNLQSGEELDMGTGFDHFSDTAHVDFKDLPARVLENRELLQQLMEAQGFKVLNTEWWHFYLPNTKDYDLMGISFSDLKKLGLRNQYKNKVPNHP
jgi:zinc D-Ala-D-Ala dipeptidase